MSGQGQVVHVEARRTGLRQVFGLSATQSRTVTHARTDATSLQAWSADVFRTIQLGLISKTVGDTSKVTINY